MIAQTNISNSTPMGATLIGNLGATFRVWAPRATAVHLVGDFGGVADWTPTPQNLLENTNGYWTGFVANAVEGDEYKYYVYGTAAAPNDKGYKRDPYARELTANPFYPHCNCVIRNDSTYNWQATSSQST